MPSEDRETERLVFLPASREEKESAPVPALFPGVQAIGGSGSVQIDCWVREEKEVFLGVMWSKSFSLVFLKMDLAQCIHLSSVDFYAASWPAGVNHMDTFALEPGGEVFFQDQHTLAGFVGCQVAFFDGAMNSVITALGQFGGFFDGEGVSADHFDTPFRLQLLSLPVCPKPRLFC